MNNWLDIGSAPSNSAIETKIDDANGERNHCTLIKDGGLWWFEDRSMYVYYQPTHWRPMK